MPPQTAVNMQQIVNAVRSMEGGLRELFAQLLRTRRRVYALDARERLRDAGRSPSMPVEFRSQFGEDIMIWDLLDGQLDGFFIEVGAFDGHSCAVTYALEAVGWKGLLVEAIPERFEQCRARRKNSRVVHAALGKRGSVGTTTFQVVEDQHGGMLSYHTTTEQHLRMLNNDKQVRKAVTVPLTTMDELLKDHTGRIDVAVIDVEGGEVDLLDGFDLARHRPRVMLIEDNDPTSRLIENAMMRHPYTPVGWVEVSRVYVHNEEKDVLARAENRH